MKEVSKDSKWIDEESVNDKEAELEARYQELKARYDELMKSTAPVSVQTSEETLVQISLLMRLYDIGMALLTHFDEPLANEVFDMHKSGGNANPPVYIPKVDNDGEE